MYEWVNFILTARSRRTLRNWMGKQSILKHAQTPFIEWALLSTLQLSNTCWESVLALYMKSECMNCEFNALHHLECGTEVAEALCNGKSSTDEPKIWFKNEKQSQRLYSRRDTHDTANHTLRRRTCDLSLTVWLSLPPHDSQGAVSHTPKQKYILSSVYTSDVGFLGKGPNPSIPRIGQCPRSNLPDVGLRYLMSEVFNTTDWCVQGFPHGFQGTW